ncbi:MAG: polyribonucleotide nucleotidyltransferase, partial [Deltaproteobacteria bacterium]
MRVETRNTKQSLAFETGMLARQANASILAIQGDSRVLVTVTVSKEERKGIDFLPLVVDYQEMSFAVGRIPGGFIKREGRPSDQEILTARFIDRPIRPLIPKGFFNEIQIIATVLSGDPSNNPDVMAINAASAALHISEVPFKGPLAGVRVGFIDGSFVINPPLDHQDGSDMDIIVVGTEDAIVMVEGEAKELPEDTVVRALDFAHSEIKKICQAQDELREKAGKEKMPFHAYGPDDAMYEKVKAFAGEKLEQIMLGAYAKQDRHARTDALRAETLEHFADDAEDISLGVNACFSQLEKEIVRALVLGKGRRVDGRNVDEIRPI